MSIAARRILRASSSASRAQRAVLRIACGQGTPVAAATGPAWAADTGFSGTTNVASTTATIDLSRVTSPAPMTIYQNERWATGPLTYTPTGLTPNAAYTIAFHAAEVYYTAAGQRVMNVSCNGTTVITGFDIFASAGGQNKAVVRSVTTSTDGTGTITIVFTCTSSGNDPKICGIEVLGNVTPNNAPTQLQIQASSTYVTLAWNAPLVPTGTVTGYTVYQNGVKLTATPITTTSYRPGQDSSTLTPLTSYTFVVKTVINGVESTGSVSGQATTTAATTGGVTYPLQIAANGHSLQDAGGKPFLTVAETSWTMSGSPYNQHTV